MIAIIVIVIMITITTITILMVTVTIFGTILKSIKYITVTWARSRWEKKGVMSSSWHPIPACKEANHVQQHGMELWELIRRKLPQVHLGA